MTLAALAAPGTTRRPPPPRPDRESSHALLMRDSAFPSHSQAGDGPSMPRSAAEPKGARHARGLDGAAPVWPPPSPRLRRAGPHGTIRQHHQKHQGFSGFYALGAKVPPACHPLQANKIKRLSHQEPTMAPSDKPLVPSKTMCRQPLSATLAAVLLSCRPTLGLPPTPLSFDLFPPTGARSAAGQQNPCAKSCHRGADFVSISKRIPMRYTPGFASADTQNPRYGPV